MKKYAPEVYTPAIKRLVKPSVLDEVQNEVFLVAQNIVATHGTNIAQVVNLAIYGRFIGGHSDLDKNFFTTPNHNFKNWSNYGLGDDYPKDYQKSNAFKVGVDYSETADVTGSEEDLDFQSRESGVVIAFNKKLLNVLGITFCTTDENIPEMVLPQAPGLDTIQGIYAVEESGLDALLAELDRLSPRSE